MYNLTNVILWSLVVLAYNANARQIVSTPHGTPNEELMQELATTTMELNDIPENGQLVDAVRHKRQYPDEFVKFETETMYDYMDAKAFKPVVGVPNVSPTVYHDEDPADTTAGKVIPTSLNILQPTSAEELALASANDPVVLATLQPTTIQDVDLVSEIIATPIPVPTFEQPNYNDDSKEYVLTEDDIKSTQPATAETQARNATQHMNSDEAATANEHEIVNPIRMTTEGQTSPSLPALEETEEEHVVQKRFKRGAGEHIKDAFPQIPFAEHYNIWPGSVVKNETTVNSDVEVEAYENATERISFSVETTAMPLGNDTNFINH